MISVLFLIPTLDRGGAENVLVDLVNHMDQSKFQITVQTLFDQNSQKSRLKKGIEYRTFLKHQFHGNSRLFARIPAGILYRLIVRRRYDIVVSYLEGPTTHIIAGCPYSDSKKVAWFHSALDTKKGFSTGFKTSAAAVQAYNGFDIVVFVADTARHKVQETSGISFKNSMVIYNTINSEEILERAKESISDSLFCKDEISIVSTGKITPVKGYDRLARVQNKLINAGYKTHIYILGEGKERKAIEDYTIANGISDSFTFLGFQNNPYKYIAKADLFVCSSRREGFSTAVSEALILGIPVITTDVSGMKEMLGDNEFGIITANSEEALYQGLIQLLDNPSLLRHYREKAVERGNMFNMDSTVKAAEKMLMGLI